MCCVILCVNKLMYNVVLLWQIIKAKMIERNDFVHHSSPTKQACTDIDGRARKARRLCVVREKQRFETKALLHARQNAHTGSTKGFSHLQLLVCACHLVALSGMIWLIPATQRLSPLRLTFTVITFKLCNFLVGSYQ